MDAYSGGRDMMAPAASWIESKVLIVKCMLYVISILANLISVFQQLIVNALLILLNIASPKECFFVGGQNSTQYICRL